MGLLSLGTPLDWHTAKDYNEHVRHNGLLQLINIFKQHAASRADDHFLWGDEVEYMLVDVNHALRTAKLLIDKDHILNELNDPEHSLAKSVDNNVLFHPEYGRFMIEATPLRPYDGECITDYTYVETNMAKRRTVSQAQLPANVVPLTLTTFPRMGCDNFTSPNAKPIGPASQSLFLPDEIINRHVRFPTLTANIRKRRGHKVAINLPIYPDVNTKLLDDSIPRDRDSFPSDKEPWLGAAKPGHVYMDSMGFGMGSSCLQVTFQASSISQARYLYDTLAPITPLLLSLTAAAPIFKGYLVDQDVRWNVISGLVDDRTFIERDVEPYPGYDFFGGLKVSEEVKQHLKTLGGGKGVDGDKVINEFGDTGLKTVDGKPIQKIPKSRYDSIDNYLSDAAYNGDDAYFRSDYNDIYLPINAKAYNMLLDTGVFDPEMAKHFAHLFIRDPLVIFLERIHQDNTLENDHFENLQSTNWQTLRFKPPALYPKDTTPEELKKQPGWRVEFRPMEIQLTDFENAAYLVFITLLAKAIIKFNPNFYIPISKIDKNMATAHKVDSVLNDKFWFRTPELWNINNDEFAGYDLTWFDRFVNVGNDILSPDNVYINGYYEDPVKSFSRSNSVLSCFARDGARTCPASIEVSKLTLNEIFNGNDSFPGLIKMVVKLIATDLITDQLVGTDSHCKSKDLAKDLLTLQAYLRLISDRAAGKIPTIAHWLRNKVVSSPHYNQDSKVGEKLNYDLIKSAVLITNFSDRTLMREYFGDTLTRFLVERTTDHQEGCL